MSKRKSPPPIPETSAEASDWLSEYVSVKRLPDWLDLAEVPSPRWLDGSLAPTAPVVAALQDKDPALRESLRPRLDATSMARLVDRLAGAWSLKESPKAHRWMFDALAEWGDDESMLLLADMVRDWQRRRKHARATGAIDLFRRQAGDVALAQLDEWSTSAKTPAFRLKSREAIEEAAKSLGLTPEEIGDQVVPTFGLGRDGSRVLPLGGRQITARVRGDLSLELIGPGGKTMRSVPSAAKEDDPSLVRSAADWVKVTRKRLKTLLTQQASRLERAMVAGRSWAVPRWRSLFLEHPILRVIGQRVIWGRVRSDGSTPFRIAEDLTLADVQDDLLNIADDDRIHLPHPLRWTEEECTGWRHVFADYGIAAAFLQANREVYRPEPEQLAMSTWSDPDGIEVDGRRLKGFFRRWGWSMGTPVDAGAVMLHYRVFEEYGVAAVAGHEEVFMADDYATSSPVALGNVIFVPREECRGGVSPYAAVHPIPIGQIDPVVFSETARDIHRLTGRAPHGESA